ncbi:MAG TPA: hypothetical protein ENN03_09135 [bacterium]|nr:hypothetical protein [bacterium]
MKVAYLHYHLKPGGVTTVIQHQIRAVQNVADVMVFSSTPFIESPEIPVKQIPWLAYDSDIIEPVRSEKLADIMELEMKRRWGSLCDVLHVHNPTLGKNRGLRDALIRLRDRGCPLLLQIHDFAEDGRPRLYDPDSYLEDVHYGVINARDQSVLLDAGLKPEGLHRLDNRVREFPFHESEEGDTLIYPVRAIRRKNVGEAIFVHQWLGFHGSLGITLPANSVSDRVIQKDWERFVREKAFSVHFDIGIHNDFNGLMQDAFLVITTSVNEGFGFSFLEPWTAGKAVIGRRLSVCDDFKEHGVDLDHLYTRLLIPAEFFDIGSFQKRYAAALKRAMAAFGRALLPEAVDSSLNTLTAAGSIDFGRLDETAQREAITYLVKERSAKRIISGLNPHRRLFQPDRDLRKKISKNAQTVREHWGENAFRKRLLAAYDAVIKGRVKQRIDTEAVLKAFLRPRDFTMIRWNNE